MDRISEIKHHEAIADQSDLGNSEHRWQAAKLIWEETQDGKSLREIGEAIGKSHTHVRYMRRCWELIGGKLYCEDVPFGALPLFNEAYNSEEVRAVENPRGQRRLPPDLADVSERPRRVAEDDGPSEYSAAGLITTARRALDTLIDNRAYWATIDRDQLGAIEGIERKASSLRADIIRSQTG